MLPERRADGLLIREIPEETLVYDLKRHRAYCLNRTAARVWSYCDGETTVAEMAARLRREIAAPADAELVRLALDRLERAHLLQSLRDDGGPRQPYSRREVARRLGLVGKLAVLLPVVLSVAVQTPAAAASCVSNCAGQPLSTPCDPPACTGACDGVGTCVH